MEFGTGCLKITPGHDFNDYDIGKKYALHEVDGVVQTSEKLEDFAPINIFTEEAFSNDMVPAPFNNLDRFKVRKAVLKEVENNSIILIYGSKNIIKTNDIEYDFRQDSDFLYLIGIKESNLVSLILKKDNKSKVILFRDESSEFEKQWIGTKKSNSLIKKDYAINSIYPLSQIHAVCSQIRGKYKNLYLIAKSSEIFS